jgi:hypothetical protein
VPAPAARSSSIASRYRRMIARTFTPSCRSTCLVWWSVAAAPTPTPALLTRTSRRPKRSPVPRDDAGDRLGVGEVRRDGLHLVPAVPHALRRRFERVGLASADRQTMALGGEGLGEREPDAAAGSGHDGGAVGHQGAPSNRARCSAESNDASPGPDACGPRRRETRPRGAVGNAVAPGPGSRNYDMISVRCARQPHA